MESIAEWRFFQAVAERQGFARGAEALGRSPQAATRAVAALERRLGLRLFHRTTRSLALTDAGLRCLERCRRVLAAVDELDRVADEHAAPRGTIAVAAPVLFGQLHVLPLVCEWLEAHPDTRVRLLLADRVVNLVEEGADVAVRIGELSDSSLRVRLCGHVRSVVCASPAYLARRGTPRRVAELAQHTCVAMAGSSASPDRWTFGDTTVTVRPRLVVTSAAAAIAAAVAGLGLTRALSYQIAADVAAGRLRVVLQRHEPAPRPVHLVHLPGAPVRAAEVFADLAFARLRATLKRDAE